MPPSAPVFLSIDVGTSSTKLTVFDGAGQPLASCAAGYPVQYPRADWAEQDPRDWWHAVTKLSRKLADAGHYQNLAAIGISGQTPLCAPLDGQGEPLRDAILWLDRRATRQVEWLRQHLGEEYCLSVSGNRLDSYFGGPKWLWLRQEEPHIFARTWKIMQASSYVTWKLTSEVVIDPSQAGLCNPCFNLQSGQWDESVCREMGLPLEMLPAVRPSQAVVGQVSLAAARETGLPAGTPVACGGGDFACAGLGAGVAGSGQAAMMLGTAGNLLFPGHTNPDPRLLHTIHLDGSPLTLGGVLAGGNLSWYASLLGGANDPDFYQRMDEVAAAVPPGAEGLLFLPYIMGERTPIWDPGARGAFIGLSSRHTPAHLYRAILEGVAFAFRQIAEIAGAPMNSVTAIDGGARSPLWRSILAAMLDTSVAAGGSRSGTALGSAFLAALSVDYVQEFGEIRAWVETGAPSVPDPVMQARYAGIYPIYRGLYPKLKDDFTALA